MKLCAGVYLEHFTRAIYIFNWSGITNNFISFDLQADLKSQITSAGDKLVVIDFFATWCGPCKMISPKLTELSQQYAEKLVVLKVSSEINWGMKNG